MPIYEYRCRGCGADFERYVAGSAAATGVACPTCAGGDVMRKLSVFGMKSAGAVMSAPSMGGGGGGGCCGGGCGCH
jgi:putative FmdB family regulatory protein